MNRPVKKVLIIRTDRLGDFVLTLPMASAIKKARSSMSVSFLVNNYTREVAERSPAIDQIISISGDEGVFKLAGLMRRAKADAVFIPSPKFNLALAAFFAGIPIRVGTGYRWYSLLFNRRVKAHRREGKYHEAEHNLRMISEIGIDADLSTLPHLQIKSDDHIRVDDWLIQRFGKTSARYVVFHIPTRGSSLDWSVQSFAELAKKVEQEFDLQIILTGTTADQAMLESVRSMTPNAKLFIGFSIAELAALLSRAKLVVANSTGPGHLAAALGAASIGLFPLPKALAKERWGFRGPNVRNKSPQPIGACPNCNNCSCMERITVADVVQDVRKLLTETASTY
jgi:ADP-heptose:LPS heptosyltransferase